MIPKICESFRTPVMRKTKDNREGSLARFASMWRCKTAQLGDNFGNVLIEIFQAQHRRRLIGEQQQIGGKPRGRRHDRVFDQYNEDGHVAFERCRDILAYVVIAME